MLRVGAGGAVVLSPEMDGRGTEGTAVCVIVEVVAGGGGVLVGGRVELVVVVVELVVVDVVEVVPGVEVSGGPVVVVEVVGPVEVVVLVVEVDDVVLDEVLDAVVEVGGSNCLLGMYSLRSIA